MQRKEHEKRHNSKDQYLCKVCEETFSEQELLESHQNVHMKMPLLDPLLDPLRDQLLDCEQCCEKSFKGKEELQRHMGTHSRLTRMWQHDK